MRLTGNWLLAQRLVTTTVYKLLRLVFITVQRIYWQLNGTAQKLREARLPHNYERSAQVLDVVLFHKFCRGHRTTVDNFLCTHNRFENPQYIIDNENVTLLTFTEHDAVFCETKEKGMHLWRAKYGSFMRCAQMDFCTRLIVVPLTTFHRLAEVIGDPQGELIFLFQTGRCGSTLVTQLGRAGPYRYLHGVLSSDMTPKSRRCGTLEAHPERLTGMQRHYLKIMENTGRCVALAEPNSPYVFAKKFRDFGDSLELRQLARDVVRWECRPYPTIQPPPLGYFLKLIPSCIVVLPILQDLFPSSRYLFMYRDVVTVAKSVYRLSMVIPSLRLACLLGRFFSRISKSLLAAHGAGAAEIDGSQLCMRLDDDLTAGVILSAATTASYLHLRRRGFDARALRYEDLVARPLDMCRVVLEFCHLPVSLAELAVKAFDVDSQANSIAAKSAIGHFTEPQLTPQVKTKLNEILKKCGVPLIGEPNTIEGTLS